MLLEEFDVKKYERSLREEGREEGRNLTLIRQAYKKYAKNLTVEETSEMLEEEPETIRKIYSAIKTVGTADTEKIYAQYIRETENSRNR